MLIPHRLDLPMRRAGRVRPTPASWGLDAPGILDPQGQGERPLYGRFPSTVLGLIRPRFFSRVETGSERVETGGFGSGCLYDGLFGFSVLSGTGVLGSDDI